MAKRGPKRLHEGKKEEIRRLNAEGVTDVEIADLLGVAPVTVLRYRREMGVAPLRRGKSLKKRKPRTRVVFRQFIEEYVRRNRKPVLS